jgi:hypothetical protein
LLYPEIYLLSLIVTAGLVDNNLPIFYEKIGIRDPACKTEIKKPQILERGPKQTKRISLLIFLHIAKGGIPDWGRLRPPSAAGLPKPLNINRNNSKTFANSMK